MDKWLPWTALRIWKLIYISVVGYVIIATNLALKFHFPLFSKMTRIKTSQSCRKFFLWFSFCLHTKQWAPLSTAPLSHQDITVYGQHVKFPPVGGNIANKILEPQKHRGSEGHLAWKLKCHWKSSTTLFVSKYFILDLYLYRKAKRNLVLLPSRMRKVLNTFVCHWHPPKLERAGDVQQNPAEAHVWRSEIGHSLLLACTYRKEP